MNFQIDSIDTIHKVNMGEWNRVARGPYFSHEWFQFVESVTTDDLQPHYLLARQQGELAAVLPAFIPRTHHHTYANYLFGRARDRLVRLPPFRRRPIVCYSPCSGGAYMLSDNEYGEEVLLEMVKALENAAQRHGKSEVAFLCIKDSETAWTRLLEKRGYRRVYLNSVAIIANRFTTFDDYLSSLSPQNRKSVKGDLRAFRKGRCTIDVWDDTSDNFEATVRLIGYIDQRYPSTQRDFSRQSLLCSFEHMRPYQTHYGVTAGDLAVGCMTIFEKDRLINTYAFGLDFARTHANRAYFNLLYYHGIREMIARKAPYLNFNQMAYRVKESRGCTLVGQAMYVKVLRTRWLMAPWMKMLNRRYRGKFDREYGRSLSAHHRNRRAHAEPV